MADLDHTAKPPVASGSKALLWVGRVVSALPVLGLTFSGVVKLTRSAEVLQEMTRLGWPTRVLVGLGIVELTCTLLYVIPHTSMLGAVLLTGYLGGAVATHVRIGESFLAPVIVGVLVWLGLLLRERRLRAIFPLRGKTTPAAEK